MAGGDTRFRDKVRGLADLPVRLVSGLVMVALTIAALWLGSWWWAGFVILLSSLVLWEWNRLVRAFPISASAQLPWMLFGTAYVCAAALAIMQVRFDYEPIDVLFIFVAPIVAVDVGAYFSGRAIGGPKIAPSISPSKTWAGGIGGAIAASLVGIGAQLNGIGPAALPFANMLGLAGAVLAGFAIAVLAQGGDFFESWMKRRAGVKDSSNLIPGHGGVFDRLDGFLAVFFVLFLVANVPDLLG